jgi:2-polyprenyl-6-methoxyphenol hydroxylase-like FAD-dependent oxidoreductase
MNTGILDAHNIAWKLAFGVKQERLAQSNTFNNTTGEARVEKLLTSYETERRPIAVLNTALSLQNWEEALQVLFLLLLAFYAQSLSLRRHDELICIVCLAECY